MSIPSWAVKGAKVVCVLGGDLPGHPPFPGVQMPVTGAIYTIRDVYWDEDGIFFRLAEIVNAPRQYSDGFEEVCFQIRRFRPLVSRTAEQDIAEHFAHYLHQPVSETEAA